MSAHRPDLAKSSDDGEGLIERLPVLDLAREEGLHTCVRKRGGDVRVTCLHWDAGGWFDLPSSDAHSLIDAPADDPELDLLTEAVPEGIVRLQGADREGHVVIELLVAVVGDVRESPSFEVLVVTELADHASKLIDCIRIENDSRVQDGSLVALTEHTTGFLPDDLAHLTFRDSHPALLQSLFMVLVVIVDQHLKIIVEQHDAEGIPTPEPLMDLLTIGKEEESLLDKFTNGQNQLRKTQLTEDEFATLLEKEITPVWSDYATKFNGFKKVPSRWSGWYPDFVVYLNTQVMAQTLLMEGIKTKDKKKVEKSHEKFSEAGDLVLKITTEMKAKSKNKSE